MQMRIDLDREVARGLASRQRLKHFIPAYNAVLLGEVARGLASRQRLKHDVRADISSGLTRSPGDWLLVRD